MILSVKNLTVIIFSCAVAVFALSENILALPKKPTGIGNLRKLFKTATGNEFELVRDEIRGNNSSHTGGRYWLAHVKPKQSGFYILKYTYKNDRTPNNYPEEGEHQLNINVGEKICYRSNIINAGISSYCLGDTIILPVRLDGVSAHAFHLESRKQAGENLAESQKRERSFLRYSKTDQIENPLEINLKVLGTASHSSPFRACCKERIAHYAYFEAVGAGRFNLSVSALRGGERLENLTSPDEGGIPIIIVNPGTPITALLPSEKTVNYADKKRFSAHAGNSFITNVLILQPGDVFAVQYSEYTTTGEIGGKMPERAMLFDIKPVVRKLPFAIDRKWSFNEWIADYLPKEK